MRDCVRTRFTGRLSGRRWRGAFARKTATAGPDQLGSSIDIFQLRWSFLDSTWHHHVPKISRPLSCARPLSLGRQRVAGASRSRAKQKQKRHGGDLSEPALRAPRLAIPRVRLLRVRAGTHCWLVAPRNRRGKFSETEIRQHRQTLSRCRAEFRQIGGQQFEGAEQSAGRLWI